MKGAVLFDLDNTLVNRKLAFREYSERLMDRYLIVSSPEERESILDYIREADRDGYRRKAELYNELLEQFNWKKETSLDELLDFWSSEFYKCTILMEGALEVIHHLKEKQIKLGIITNGAVYSQHAKIDQVGLRKYFDTIVVSDEVKLKKPDPQIFELALERLNVEAEHSFYIGDHSINDVAGAEDAGLTAIWFEGFREWEVDARKPQYRIGHLKELIDVFEQIGL
ncbi:HAD family hydrolase [Paenibacillus sp. J2TS4]|uniref:HAD family hydrolase n=1 Tax=Paenibacillus sp. J2TS4 TaxID=2807194 RepID=UPI001B1983F3|nr:HAD family hydrolase [Paenibacillus sp. J2TS4]GIP32778.1 2-haloalkanoic acid dehalogenase [Paenibacillus sp. J2TS4]